MAGVYGCQRIYDDRRCWLMLAHVKVLSLFNGLTVFRIIIVHARLAVAYPELVSRGVSKSRKFNWLVKIGACKDVNPLIKKKSWPGGFPGNQKTPLDTPLVRTDYRWHSLSAFA